MEKQRKINRKTVIKIVTVIMSVAAFALVIFLIGRDRPVYKNGDTSGTSYEVGKVLRVLADNKTVDEENDGIWRGSMTLEVRILSGKYKGQTAVVENYFSSLYNVRVSEGDKVSIRIDASRDGEYQVSVYNYYRVPQIIGCLVLFAALLILIGGKKGAKSVIGLAFTVVCIIWILLPLALNGFSPLAATIIIACACNFVTFFLIDGIKKKTVTASICSVLGVLAGAAFSTAAQHAMSVTTYQMDEAETLLLITSTTKLHIKDLFMCGILISCMGAVMDVAMSICSAVSELHHVNESLGVKELFKSGMNIGRDAMGTMSNTLILAFAGNSLNMILMIYSCGIGFQQLMNTDFTAIEIIRCIAGSIGIICTVPITAFVSALAYGRRKK